MANIKLILLARFSLGGIHNALCYKATFINDKHNKNEKEYIHNLVNWILRFVNSCYCLRGGVRTADTKASHTKYYNIMVIYSNRAINNALYPHISPVSVTFE